MIVWIVVGGWSYEGSKVLGVYATEALAEEKVSKEKAHLELFDFVYACEFVVEG
jgi:hypothetical protein